MRRIPLAWVFLIVLILYVPLSTGHTQTDIYEDASYYGYDLKQAEEDEIFFYESRFVDFGLHLGGRTFTGGLGKLFGTGFSIGGYFTYFFSRRFALEITVNNSFHKFLIDGKRGNATVLDVLARGKFYFISDGYSRALSFANPFIFIGGGQFIRSQSRSDIQAKNSTSGPGIEFGGGFEIPLKERTVFLGIKPSYQIVFFHDENNRTELGTKLNGDLVNFVMSLTYSF